MHDDVYGDTLTNYLNAAAFAYPAAGTLGNHSNQHRGSGILDGRPRAVEARSIASQQTLELRVEAFNLLNHFNWGNPAANYDSRNFGRITATSGRSAHHPVWGEVWVLTPGHGDTEISVYVVSGFSRTETGHGDTVVVESLYGLISLI